MERLKITAISLSITILVFLLGPLVLSALIYYAYTYCGDRPDKKFKIKVEGMHALIAFISLFIPYAVALVAEQTYLQRDLYDVLKFVFSFKIVRFYSFSYELKYVFYLIADSVAHLFSVYFVFMFSIHVAKYRKEKYLGLNGVIKDDENVIESKRFWSRVVFFMFMFFLVVNYYFSIPGAEISEVSPRARGKGPIFHVSMLPLYIVMNLLYVLRRKAK